MYLLKIWDNEKKEVILEVKSKSFKVIISYAIPYGTSRYKLLITFEEKG